MEMTPIKTMERMVRQASCGGSPSPGYVREFNGWTDGKLWIYDHLGMIDPKKMLAVVRYCRDTYGVDHVVVDSLMKCGMKPDDYGGQKAFLDGLTGIAMETGVHIHLVAHARKGEKETDRLDKFDIKGTSEITDQVDNVILIQRNKRKEADRDGKLADEPDAYLTIAKQRHGDWEGTAGLWYDHPSQSYLPFASASPIGIDL
jgi:twinkle protein